MSVNVILSGHGMNSEPYLANLAATEEGIAYIYNAKRDLDEAEGEFYLTSELMDQPLDMTSLDENGELSDFITALRVWDRVAKENVAKKIDFQSLGNFPKGSINQILAYSEVDEEGNPTGFKAMAALGGVNANLLHNWYFADPVNRRGQTEYTGGVQFTVDRWKMTNANSLTEIKDRYLHLASLTADSTPYLQQSFESPSLFLGKKVTLSVLLANGQIHSTTTQLPTSFPSALTLYGNIANVCDILVGASTISVRLKAEPGGARDILAVKLELGDTQTLAHQDADGNWVLNEIPNHGEELIRCQSAPVDIDGAGGVLPLTGGTVTGTLHLSSTVDAEQDAERSPALIIGNKTGEHLEFDNNELMAKSTATTSKSLGLGECNLHTTKGEGIANTASPRIRNIYAGTSSMTSGTTSLVTGRIYLQYE